MFRFTIRDELWLMVVVALGVGWWLNIKRETARNYKAEMLNWQFRAETLQEHIERGAGNVVFFRGKWGEQVTIRDSRGVNVYHDKIRP